VRSSVEHHVDDALDMPVDRGNRADVQAEAPGNRRAHGLHVQDFPFDFAGF
jgi:hypothetical protein